MGDGRLTGSELCHMRSENKVTEPSKATVAFNLEQQRRALEERQKIVRVEFVEVELDLAVTFCQIALSSGESEKIERNKAHAEEAFESAMHFLNTAEAPEPLKERIEEKLAHLRGLLDQVHKKV